MTFLGYMQLLTCLRMVSRILLSKYSYNCEIPQNDYCVHIVFVLEILTPFSQFVLYFPVTSVVLLFPKV